MVTEQDGHRTRKGQPVEIEACKMNTDGVV